jgi:hypothetical protein
MAWMTLNVFKNWMMTLNEKFRSPNLKVLLIMDNFATHSFKDVGRGESFDFSTLQSRTNHVAFLPPNVQVRYNPWIKERCFIQSLV